MNDIQYLTWRDLVQAGWPTGGSPEAVNDNQPSKPQLDEIDRQIAHLEVLLAAFHAKRATPSK